MFRRPFSPFKIIDLLHFSVLLFFSLPHAYSQNSARFISPGDYIEIPHHVSLAPSQLTVEFWLKVNATEDSAFSDQQTVIDKRGHDTPGYIIYLTGKQFPIRVDATLNPGDIEISQRILPNTWYHIAITQDADSAKGYMNGRLKSSIRNDYTANTTSPLVLGELLDDPNSVSSFMGEIDELRVWNYARSQNEIEASMYDKMTGTEEGLTGYWDLDSIYDTGIPDLTGNGNKGVLHGNTSLVYSDAPCNPDALPAPVGLRAHGGDGKVDLAWKEGDSSVAAYALYRSDSRYFLLESNTLIATVEKPGSSFSDTQVKAGTNYYYLLKAINQKGNEGRSGKSAMGRIVSLQEDYMTGVHYFQWYGTPTDLAHHIDGESLRSLLVPEQPPLLGYYSSSDPHVIRQHLKWMESYGIDFISVLWNRYDTWERTTLINHILPIIAGSNIQFMVEYGPHSLVTDFDDTPVFVDSELEEMLASDFIGIMEDFFDHPNYLTIDSRYPVYLYISRLFAGNYRQAFERVRSELQMRGFDLFLIGDEMSFENLNEEHIQYVDAVSPYILHSARYDGYPVETDYFADLSLQAIQWETVTKPSGIAIIPNATMGLNKRREDLNVVTLPPQSEAGASCTSTLEEAIKAMLPFIDPQLSVILLTSWNEYHEDTVLEPLEVSPATAKDISPSGSLYTEGYFYEGHGFKPLEVIRDLLAPGLNLQTIDHFTYMDTGKNTYSISLSEAMIDGELLELGDEVGVFDGKHCVGAVAVSNNYWPMGFWAWMDESETEITDGFVTGNTMSFQIWDASSNQKYTAVPTYIKGDGKFGTGPYSQISLKSNMLLLEPDTTVQVFMASEFDTIAFAFTGGGNISIILTGGEITGQTVSVRLMETTPPELPVLAAFQNPVYYLDLETSARDFNATLLIGYSESLLREKGILESDLEVKIWNADDQVWESVPVMVDTAENIITISKEHIALFALISKKDELPSGIDEDTCSGILQNGFVLEQNSPNPFSQATMIKYAVPNPGNVTLIICDICGRMVEMLVNEFQTAGEYQVNWTSEGVPGGMYFYKLQTTGFSETKKLLIQK